jgi:hypothetical protein
VCLYIDVAYVLMKRMPTANVPGRYLLHHFQSLEAPVLWFAPVLEQADFLEQRLGLLRVHLQRYMGLLHTFLLANVVGFKEHRNNCLSNCSDRAAHCQEV